MSSSTVAALEVVLQREQAPAMEELRRELAAARRANSDLQDHNAFLEQHLDFARDFRVEQHNLRAEREILLTREGDRLARWAAQGRVEEDMPIEVWRAVQLMRQGDGVTRIPVGIFSFVEMADDSAAVP